MKSMLKALDFSATVKKQFQMLDQSTSDMDNTRMSAVSQFAAFNREQLMQKLEETEEENANQANTLEVM